MGDPTTLERKLFLLAGGLPPSAPRRFGIKNTERAAEWELKPFKNVARADELELRHWVRKRKASDAVDEDGEVYPFVKYNVVIDVPEYTPEEYERHLRIDPQWGKAETDYLFDLCRQYDCRWPVIMDIYQFGDSKRTVEDLKDRYYRACKRLYEARVAKGDRAEEYQRKLEMGGYDFDKTMELNRKRQLEALLSRSHEQIKEEELLFTELKRREAMNERFFEMRHFAERTYGKHELSHSIDRAQMQYYGQNANDPRLKKKQRPDVPGAGPVISIPQARAPSGSGLPSATPTTPSLEVPRRETKVVSGTNLRSGMTVQLKGQALQKVNEYLTELGIPLQPTMPTAQIMRTFDELRTSVSTLLDWKKQEEVLENHVRVLRIRRDNMNALGMSPTSPMMDMSGLGKSGSTQKKKR